MKPIRAVRLPAGYGDLLAAVKARVASAQIRAALAASRELLTLYDIGRLIAEAQRVQGYGKRVVERLAADLQRAFPGIRGFSPLNVWRTRAFYLAHVGPRPTMSQAATESALPEKLSQAVTESPTTPGGTPDRPPEPFASLPRGHNLLLLHKLKKSTDRLWYATQAIEHGWSRNVLALQIDSRLHRRQGRAVTNFRRTLPPPQSDLAQNITKDPYVFDFLSLTDGANERAVEAGLLGQVEKFLLELGAGFALVGRQIHLEIGGQDHYLDLLFYHLKLRCFVVVDLKVREFTPEAAGKMNFYLSAVDDRFRQPGDQPSLGLILCRDKNRIVAEYALRHLRKPIGVSDYVTRLVGKLPKALQAAVPTVQEIEQGLSSASRSNRQSSRQRRRRT